MIRTINLEDKNPKDGESKNILSDLSAEAQCKILRTTPKRTCPNCNLAPRSPPRPLWPDQTKVFTALVTLEQPKRCLIIQTFEQSDEENDTTKEEDKYIYKYKTKTFLMIETTFFEKKPGNILVLF